MRVDKRMQAWGEWGRLNQEHIQDLCSGEPPLGAEAGFNKFLVWASKTILFFSSSKRLTLFLQDGCQEETAVEKEVLLVMQPSYFLRQLSSSVQVLYTIPLICEYESKWQVLAFLPSCLTVLFCSIFTGPLCPNSLLVIPYMTRRTRREDDGVFQSFILFPNT